MYGAVLHVVKWNGCDITHGIIFVYCGIWNAVKKSRDREQKGTINA